MATKNKSTFDSREKSFLPKTALVLSMALILLLSSLAVVTSFDTAAALPSKNKPVGQHVPNDESMTIESIDFSVKKSAKTGGTITVEIIQDDISLASADVDTDKIKKNRYYKLTAEFDDPVQVDGDFDVVFSYDGKGKITVKQHADKKNKVEGNAFKGDTELAKVDLTLKIHAAETTTGSEPQPPAQPTPTPAPQPEPTPTPAPQPEPTPTPAPQPEPQPQPSPTPPPPSADASGITVYAYRIPSQYWGATFTSANANMFFGLYDSSGTLIQTAFVDENGYTFGGLVVGATYYVYAADCGGCHDSDHDVFFRYWENGSSDRPRAVNPGAGVGAYFEYVKWS